MHDTHAECYVPERPQLLVLREGHKEKSQRLRGASLKAHASHFPARHGACSARAKTNYQHQVIGYVHLNEWAAQGYGGRATKTSAEYHLPDYTEPEPSTARAPEEEGEAT